MLQCHRTILGRIIQYAVVWFCMLLYKYDILRDFVYAWFCIPFHTSPFIFILFKSKYEIEWKKRAKIGHDVRVKSVHARWRPTTCYKHESEGATEFLGGLALMQPSNAAALDAPWSPVLPWRSSQLFGPVLVSWRGRFGSWHYQGPDGPPSGPQIDSWAPEPLDEWGSHHRVSSSAVLLVDWMPTYHRLPLKQPLDANEVFRFYCGPGCCFDCWVSLYNVGDRNHRLRGLIGKGWGTGYVSAKSEGVVGRKVRFPLFL